MEYKLPKINSSQQLLDFIDKDMEACISSETIQEIKKMSNEELSKLESITVDRSVKNLGKPMTFNYKK